MNWQVTREEAEEFLSLHNKRIRDFNEGMDPIDFFNRATERDPMERDDNGTICIEIRGHESHTGNPILFYLERSGLDWQWQVGWYRKPFDERITPQDHEGELEFFNDENEAQEFAEQQHRRGYYEITLTSPGAEQTWELIDGEWI